MVSVKLSLIPNFAIWDLPHDYPPTLSIPTVDKSSIFSRAPFSIPENLFFRSLDYKWPLLLASSYVLIVKTWNYVNRQRGGKPWAISKTSGFFWFMVAHNVFLAVYSAWTFVGIVGAARRSFENPFTSPNGFRGTMDSLCRMQGTSGLGNAAIYNSSPSSQSWFKSHPLTAGTTQTAVNAYLPKPDQLGRLWNEGLAFYGWWFYISKFYEFIDTAIILLKGKQSSTLQTYHHMGACGCLFVGIKYMSPPIWIFLFFNSFIHSLMYTYYTVTSFNIRVPKAIKRSLTTAQITQFIVGGGSALLHLFVYYKFPTSTSAIKSAIGLKEGDEPWVPCLDTSAQAFAVWFNVIYLTPLTYLFARFFVRSYLRSSSTTAGAGQGKKKDVRSTLQAAERAGKDAVEEFGRAEVLENTSAGRSTASAVGVNGNGNGNGAASRKGWERTNKVVD